MQNFVDILKTTARYTSDDVMILYITYISNKTVIMGKTWDYGKNIYNF